MIPDRWNMLIISIDWVMICVEMGSLHPEWIVFDSIGALAEAL